MTRLATSLLRSIPAVRFGSSASKGPLRRSRLNLESLETRELLDGGLAGGFAQVGLTEGWATFGQVVPQGYAYEALQLGDLPTQNDIKNYWPDGSIKFALLTTMVPQAGTYPVRTAAPYEGIFAPGVAEVYAGFNFGWGTCYAVLPTDVGQFDLWLAGPLVAEGRMVVSPVCDGGWEHPTLTVLFDYRAYVDGQFRVDVTVENTLDQVGAGRVDYDVALVVNGQVTFARNGVQHYYLTRWRHVAAVGMFAEAQVTPDFNPVFEAAALPYILPIVANRLSVPVGPNFDILRVGDLNPYMPESSGRPELAPYPEWTARYLVHREPVQKSYVTANGDLAGSWPVHIRQPGGGLVSINQRPRYWVDIPLNRGEDRPAGNMTETGPYLPDVAHQPSLAYVPYLMTGDRYYADEMAFWANFTLLFTFPGDGSYRGANGEGYLWPNETRGYAWGLRNIVDAAAYLPDGDIRKSYLEEKVYHNLSWLENHAATQAGPLGVAWHWPIGFAGDNYYEDPERTRVWQSVSQHNLLAWAIDHANKQGYVGGQSFMLAVAQFNISLLSNPVTRDGAAPYWTAIGTRTPPGSPNITWYNRLEQTYRGPSQYPGLFGADARLMVLVGLEYGLPGSQAAYDYLHPQLAIDVFQQFMSDLALRAGWALSLGGELNPGRGRLIVESRDSGVVTGLAASAETTSLPPEESVILATPLPKEDLAPPHFAATLADLGQLPLLLQPTRKTHAATLEEALRLYLTELVPSV